MAIDLSSEAAMYQDLREHVGHELELVMYARGANVAIECVTCGTVLLSADRPPMSSLLRGKAHGSRV